jgi:hypothetical protein
VRAFAATPSANVRKFWTPCPPPKLLKFDDPGMVIVVFNGLLLPPPPSWLIHANIELIFACVRGAPIVANSELANTDLS